MRNVLVTGGSGFVARALFSRKRPGFRLIAASRRETKLDGVEWRPSPELGPEPDWGPILEGVDIVVHLAGRAHLTRDEDLAAYDRENFQGTMKLARDAQKAGVRAFLFVSSAKVLGEESGSVPPDERTQPRPGDAYARSKFAAERGLGALGGDMAVTVLRPPLVYGPGVRANFLALFSAIARGLPLPLGSVANRRSLIYVGNLAEAIFACCATDASAVRTYHVTDGAPVSTPELILEIAKALRKRPGLFPFPVGLLEGCGRLVGRLDTVKRLTRSLELDDRAIGAELGWRPPFCFEEGIASTAAWFEGRLQRGQDAI